ncbi:hypothetical protein DVR12_20025 [Chitinophaga silvatica]|uniref:Outer membrane protein beta-barrel domain-containing protein n=1 Tax=Chitinophaga silvatica TaxID=2282649 RepID=A0A3E1Y5L3_9BACT|nr:TonB-dependent receptor [Chitinophaga silvatica]RFS20015.1 hypothetical protein DVR12_20025 [Chitinophaga silvatica]
MHKFLLTAALLFLSGASLFAQFPTTPKSKPIAVRRVNGVVRDSLGKAVPAAAVRLVSSKDTLHTLTSEYGVFNFPVVHSESFTLEVQMASYHPFFKKYFLNDTRPILVLPPLILTSSLVQLKGIVVTTAKGPQQRGDTTEFWAKDYIVREYARLEDMLKRMEGFSTDANGRLSYNGKPVNKALFNGAKYFDGDVAAAIKELPADIVERIQVIQDNEDGTGPKSSPAAPSSQTLNIVTKVDKSAGQMYLVALEAGTNDRYKESGSAKTIDGQRMWSVNVSNIQEPAGIVSTRETPLGSISNMTEYMLRGSGGGSAGGRSNGTAAKVIYNDKIGKLGLNLLYEFYRTHNLNESEEVSEEFYKEGSLKRNSKNKSDNTDTRHALSVSADLHNKEFRMMTNLIANLINSENENLREINQTGILDNLQRTAMGRHSQSPTLQANSVFTFYERRKVSLVIKVNNLINKLNGSGNDNTDIFSTNNTKPDSSLYLLQQQKTLSSNNSIGAVLSYKKKAYTFSLDVSPLVDKNANINYRDELIHGQPPRRLDELSNDNVLINYRIPVRLGLSYSVGKLSLDVRGTYETIWRNAKFNMKDLALSNHSAVFLPGMMFRYDFGAVGTLSLNYNRLVNLPSLLQLSASPYYTTPFDVAIGNPNLKNGIINNYSMNYTYPIPRARLLFSAGTSLNKTSNNIGANRLIQIDSETHTIRTETYYLNVAGGEDKSVDYTLSKNFKLMNTSLRFGGRNQWRYQIYLADGNHEMTHQQMNRYDFTAMLKPIKWLDLAPSLVYNSNNNKNSLQPGRPLFDNQLNLQLDASIFFTPDFKMNISARQNISRASSMFVNQHPFILNANIEKRILKKKDAIISFMVMDAFQQNNNNVITQTVTGYSNAISNLKSRYFLCQLLWSPQRFIRSKLASGERRGDGSFVPER